MIYAYVNEIHYSLQKHAISILSPGLRHEVTLSGF